MPTYEFRCTACGHQFEVFQSMSAPDPAACEECHAEGALEKVLFPVAVHYKGSGFYSTDYSGKGGGKDGKDGNAGGDRGASAGTSSDSGSSSGDSTSSSSSSSDGSSPGSGSSSGSASSTD